VLQTTPGNGCTRTELWQLNAGRPIKKISGTKPGIPTRIAPGTQIIAIVPALCCCRSHRTLQIKQLPQPLRLRPAYRNLRLVLVVHP
jgi:hypothetical protein